MLLAPILKAFIEGQSLAYKQTSISYVFDCPRCGKKDKLYLRKADGRFVCWYCRQINGFQGRPEYALAELLNQPISNICAKLYGKVEADSAGYLDVKLNDFLEDDEYIEEAIELPTVDWPYGFYSLNFPSSKKGIDYLEGRGISRDIAKEYNITYSPGRRRVGFPVIMNGRMVGWQARLTVPAPKEIPKITSCVDNPRDTTLMFSDRLKGSDHAILTEGPVDALKCHLCGGNVASMGKVVTLSQIGLLRNSGIKRLYLALDLDANVEIRKMAEGFSDIEVRLMMPPPPWEDIGAMPMGEVYKLYCNAPLIRPGQLFAFFSRKVG